METVGVVAGGGAHCEGSRVWHGLMRQVTYAQRWRAAFAGRRAAACRMGSTARKGSIAERECVRAVVDTATRKGRDEEVSAVTSEGLSMCARAGLLQRGCPRWSDAGRREWPAAEACETTSGRARGVTAGWVWCARQEE